MSKLRNEPFEKMVDDKLSEPIEAFEQSEEVWGTIQCNNCGFWGKMTGYIEAHDKRCIKFICPDCNTVESVRNWEHQG